MPIDVARKEVEEHFKGAVKPPFNREGRVAAGLGPTYYEPLANASARAEGVVSQF